NRKRSCNSPPAASPETAIAAAPEKKLEKVRPLDRAAAPKDAPSWARRRRTGPRSGAQAPDVTPKLHPLADEATGHRRRAASISARSAVVSRGLSQSSRFSSGAFLGRA